MLQTRDFVAEYRLRSEAIVHRAHKDGVSLPNLIFMISTNGLSKR
jgi:hypothetical protein